MVDEHSPKKNDAKTISSQEVQRGTRPWDHSPWAWWTIQDDTWDKHGCGKHRPWPWKDGKETFNGQSARPWETLPRPWIWQSEQTPGKAETCTAVGTNSHNRGNCLCKLDGSKTKKRTVMSALAKVVDNHGIRVSGYIRPSFRENRGPFSGQKEEAVVDLIWKEKEPSGKGGDLEQNQLQPFIIASVFPIVGEKDQASFGRPRRRIYFHILIIDLREFSFAKNMYSFQIFKFVLYCFMRS